MPVQLRFTYEVITPESAEDGDVAESGWYEPGGWRYSEAPDPITCTAGEALRDIERTVGSPDHIECHGDRLTVYPADGSTNYRTGAEERIAAHVTGKARLVRALAKALGWKGE